MLWSRMFCILPRKNSRKISPLIPNQKPRVSSYFHKSWSFLCTLYDSAHSAYRSRKIDFGVRRRKVTPPPSKMIVAQTPRPTIEVEGLEDYVNVHKKNSALELVNYDIEDEHEKTVKKLLSTYRRRQTILLGGVKDSDPDPYDPTYIFYCLPYVKKD